MDGGRFDPVQEHLPAGDPRGCVLVVSDHRPLNFLHAAALCVEGYAVYTAVTCTDVPRVFDQFAVASVDLVAFASLVHGWHHREAETRPAGIPSATDSDWQVRNIRAVVDSIHGRQQRPPRVLVASELIAYNFYDVTADALTAAGIDYHTYPANDPHAIVDFLRQ